MQTVLDLLKRPSCRVFSPGAGGELKARHIFSQGSSSLPRVRRSRVDPGDATGSLVKAAMLKILVVDDEPLIAMMLADWLEDEGHQVVGPAHSLDQAAEMIETSELSAAILDVSLGEQQSFALAERLEALKVPFAFATGHSLSSVPAEFRHVATISKPFDFEVVRKIVESLAQSALKD